MKIEIWKSDQNQEEIHHFQEGKQDSYVFGMNRQLLGKVFYDTVLVMVKARLEEMAKNDNKS